MEPAAGVSQQASWSPFHTETPAEESEIMVHLLDTYPFTNEQDHHDQSIGIASMSWPSDHAAHDSYYCSENTNSNSSLYYWSQGDGSSITTTNFFAPTSGYESYYMSESNAAPATMEYINSMVEEQPTTPSLRVVPNPLFRDPSYSNEESSDDVGDPNAPDQMAEQKRKLLKGEDDNSRESLKKKPRAASQVHKSAKKAQSTRTTQKSAKSVDEEECNTATNGQTSSCYSSEDDSNTSQELNGGGGASSSSKGSLALNLNGKKRAGRGSATDPQSLYARKRRERINERLRILQNLVPNGTKVDISTMLEEAVQYVKFLQLQIKLLSSDELWMYAPIAYNGMSLGFDLKIPSSKQ